MEDPTVSDEERLRIRERKILRMIFGGVRVRGRWRPRPNEEVSGTRVEKERLTERCRATREGGGRGTTEQKTVGRRGRRFEKTRRPGTESD